MSENILSIRDKKYHLGVFVEQEDKKLIEYASKLQRRSVASFLVESALIRAREILKFYGEKNVE